jgi:hypothetical protein
MSLDRIDLACEEKLIYARLDAMSAGKAYLAATVLKTVYLATYIEEKLICASRFTRSIQ